MMEAERRGILPAEKQELLDEARRRGLVDKPPGLTERIANAVKGNAAEDIRSLDFYTFRDAEGQPDPIAAARLGITSIFGDDADKERRFAELVPNATRTQDANGNPVFETDQGRFYVNRPGLDGMDAATGFVKGAAFAPAARLAAIPAGLLARFGVGAAAAGATDVGMQAGAGRSVDEYDPEQTAITAGLGGAGELLAPVTGAITGAAKRLLASDASLAQTGRRIAQEAGIPGDLSEDVYRALGQRAGEIQGGASPASVLSEIELGTRLTRGQKTGDYAQQRLEETLRSRADGPGGAMIRDAETANRDAVARGLASMRQRLGADPSSPVEAAETLQHAVAGQYDDARRAVGAAYDSARARSASVPGEFAQSLPGRARKAVEDFDITPDLHPATSRALDLVERTMGGGQAGETLAAMDLRKIETTRRQLANLVESATNNADRTAARRVKGELDSWLDDAVDQAVIQGDQGALEALKQARAMRAKLHERFEQRGPNDQAGKIVQRMIAGDASPDQLAQMVFGAGRISPSAGANVASKLKAALGDDREAWDAMRSAVILKATSGAKDGETLGAQAIVGNLKDLLRNRPTLMKELYTPQEQAALSRFTMLIEPLVKKGDLGRSSGTAERILGAITTGFGRVPIIGQIMSAMQAPKQYWQATGALSPVRSPLGPQLPGMAPAAIYSEVER